MVLQKVIAKLWAILYFLFALGLGVVVYVYFALRAWVWSKMSIKEP